VKYTIEPEIVDGCESEDYGAGRHLYALHRWADGHWTFVGVSLPSCGSADACKRDHWWGIEFRAGDTWEDGTPITSAEHTEKLASGTGQPVTLDREALQRSAEALERHWIGNRAEDTRPKEG
jgi:hypothetical protein